MVIAIDFINCFICCKPLYSTSWACSLCFDNSIEVVTDLVYGLPDYIPEEQHERYVRLKYLKKRKELNEKT